MKVQFYKSCSTSQKNYAAVCCAILYKFVKNAIAIAFLSLALHPLSVLASINNHQDFPVDSGLFQSSFIYDFSRPSNNWRFGNNIVSKNPN